MLHTFFFAMSLVTDYQLLAQVLREGVRLGLINACLVWAVVGWMSLRGRRAAGN